MEKKVESRAPSQKVAASGAPGSEMRSFVDGVLEGLFIAGWVHEEALEGSSTVRLFIDGYLVDSFIADLYRPDLERAGIADGRRGFYYRIPDLFADGELHTFDVRLASTETSLSNSPLEGLTIKHTDPSCFELITATKLRAVLRIAMMEPSSATIALLDIDGTPSGALDLIEAESEGSSHTTLYATFDIPSRARDGQRHMLCVSLFEQGRLLHQLKSHYKARGDLVGRLDHISGPVLSGWVHDSLRVRSTATIDLMVDERRVAEVNVPISDTPIEFEVVIPSDVFDGQQHKMVLIERQQGWSIPSSTVDAVFHRPLTAYFDCSKPDVISGWILYQSGGLPDVSLETHRSSKPVVIQGTINERGRYMFDARHSLGRIGSNNVRYFGVPVAEYMRAQRSTGTATGSAANW